MAPQTPWQESIELRHQWRAEDRAAGRDGIAERRADQVEAWFEDLDGEVERYFERCRGADQGDPREALIRLLAVAGACLDAMGRDA